MHMLRFGTLASAAVLLAAVPAAAAVEPVDGDPVLYWHEVMLTVLAGSPVATSRQAAMASAAIHDAVNASLGRPNFGYLGSLETNGGDVRAAASSAAHKVLITLYPGRAADLNAALAASLALVPDGPAKTKGIATGTGMGAAILARRANDGATAVVPYAPSGEIGRYAPTPPGFGSPVFQQWGDVDPWLMTSGDQFRSAPPPVVGSAAYIAAYNEVKDIGALGSLSRTADQAAAANFWAAASGVGPWIRAAIDAAQDNGTGTLENASTMARMLVAGADATIAIFEAKAYYDYWRPVTAIRAGDADGSDATVGDATWSPFITTPPHQSYVSGHSGQAAAATTVLADAFGNERSFCLTWSGNTRCWDSFSLAAEDAANSRLWGGIHWSFDNEAGLVMGQAVADWTLSSKAFGAVPEPASWAMIILGFGIVGLAARRRGQLRVRLG
jgi:membrane-associated phospholipid phosphatase